MVYLFEEIEGDPMRSLLSSVLVIVALNLSLSLNGAVSQSRVSLASFFHPSHYLQEFEEQDYQSFHHLPINQEDMRNTYRLIHSLGTLSWYELLWQKREIESIGDKVDHLHPFRFLALIFRDPHLRECMKNIYSSSLKWHRFLKGLSEKMDKRSKAGELIPQLPGFCHVTDTDYDCVKPFIEKRDWEGFLKYMITK